MIIPNIWENRKCSKPPTRFWYTLCTNRCQKAPNAEDPKLLLSTSFPRARQGPPKVLEALRTWILRDLGWENDRQYDTVTDDNRKSSYPRCQQMTKASKGPIYKRTDDAQRTDCFSRFRDSTRYLLGHVSRSWTTYQLLGFNSIWIHQNQRTWWYMHKY